MESLEVNNLNEETTSTNHYKIQQNLEAWRNASILYDSAVSRLEMLDIFINSLLGGETFHLPIFRPRVSNEIPQCAAVRILRFPVHDRRTYQFTFILPKNWKSRLRREKVYTHISHIFGLELRRVVR